MSNELKNRINIRDDIEKILIDYRDSDKSIDIRNVAADIMTAIEFHSDAACDDDADDEGGSVLYLTPEERKEHQDALNEARRKMLDNMALCNIITGRPN